MRLGPVFAAEMRATSRRVCCYATRVGLGLFILLGFWFGYALRASPDPPSGIIATEFARLIFTVVAIMQGVAIIAITPAVMAGAIAGERSRRTLDDLLVSDLSSVQIVLGKFAARIFLVFEFLLVGLPILGGLTLLGGVEPVEVAWTFVVAASLAWFVGGISILASSVARGPREAVFAAYGRTAFWLCASPFLNGPIQSSWPSVYVWIEPIAAALALFDPVVLSGRDRRAGWVVVALFCAGTVFVSLAAGMLRSSARGVTQARSARSRAWWRRPAVGDDPMRWKETITRPRLGLVGKSIRVIFVLGSIGLGIVLLNEAAPALNEVMVYGYGAAGRAHAADRFNDVVRMSATAFFLMALLSVTATAAAAITIERAAETWTGIIASPLTASEILRAKRAGAYRRARGSIVAVVAIWTLGLIGGAVHPLGFAAACVLLPVYLASAAAVGTFASLIAKTTAKAFAVAIVTTLLLHLGLLIVCAPLFAVNPLAAFGCSPVMMYLAPSSYGEVMALAQMGARSASGTWSGEVLSTMILSILFYGAVAVGLNIAAIELFDCIEDRPSREGRGRVPDRPDADR